MRVAVLGAGIVGLTSAHELLRRGHEVAVIDRQPGPAMECSHANGGYLAISQAVPWSAPGVPAKTLLSMLRPDAPILLHPGQLPKAWRWGLDFLRASRADVSWRNTLAVLRLALYSFAQLQRVCAAVALDDRPVTGGSVKVFANAKTLAAAVAESERQRPLGLDHRVLGRAEMLRLVPALAPRIDGLSGAIHYPQEENGDCFAHAGGLSRRCEGQGVSLLYGRRILGLESAGGRIAAAVTDRGRVADLIDGRPPALGDIAVCRR